MNRHNYLTSLGLIAIALSPTLMGFSDLPEVSEQSNSIYITLDFPPTGNRKSPKTTSGGGTRSDDINCLAVKEGDTPLVALMPNRENIAKTATATPILYWYLPETKVTDGEFVLVDEQGNEVYFTNFALPKQAGIVKLTIPEKAKLQPNKTYSWSFSVICDSRYRNRDKFVEGKIEYISVDTELKNQLKNSSALEKAQLYAKESIWFETLEIMAQMRSEKQAEWQQFLQSVGLEELANQPFIECCQPKQ